MILKTLKTPAELKRLSAQELVTLAAEVRERMIAVVSKSGGHLASSLGVVELTIALQYCLDTPRDKIVWDVGHQTYAHKILTGRNEDFTCLRQSDGITGFPCREESAHDPFTTGHSSTAVSLALGLATARDLTPDHPPWKVVAVIGDGSLSGGMCFEGLNNAGHLKKDMLVVLNTNEMSIAPNVGALSTYLNKIISMPLYNRFKESLDHFIASRVPRGARLVKLVNKFEEGLKGLFVPGLFFEELGFRYFGPFDGHDLTVLIPTLKKILQYKGPILFHVITRKGKGYAPAERDPVRFHSTAPFDIATGEGVRKAGAGTKTYTEALSNALVACARKDARIVAITAAMAEGTGLDKFRDSFANRFFDVGIAEAHAVAFAGGLASVGLKPVVAIYSTFLQRAYDQIIECVALQKTGVVFCLDRAGVVGDDGATHQGIFDLAYLRTVPGMIVMSPADGEELERMLSFAFAQTSPVAIRYPKACVPTVPLSEGEIRLGSSQVIIEGGDCALVAVGSMVAPAYEAACLLKEEGIRLTVVNARFVKPLDAKLLGSLAQTHHVIITVEDGILDGGFGSAVKELLPHASVHPCALPSAFVPCGKRVELLSRYGLDAAGIIKTVKAVLSDVKGFDQTRKM